MIQDSWLRRRLLVGFALMCLGAPAFSLDPTRRVSQYVRDEWGEEKGFIGGTIYAIEQSGDGYLWIGTERGLVRFDGSNFMLIQRPIPDDPPIGRVRGLICDADGDLWVRLEGPRMLLYRDGEFEDPFRRFDLQDVIVTAMASDYRYRVLFAGLGDRALRYDHEQFETVLTADENPGTVISLAGTSDNSIWLGTRENGLFRLQSGRISKAAPELGNSKINCLSSISGGGLWIGSDDGLYFLEVGATKAVALPSLRGLHILTTTMDHEKNLWIGTNHGIVRVTPFGDVSLDLIDRKADYEVRAVYEDRDGGIWFSGPSGLERLRNGMLISFSTTDGIPAIRGGPIYVDSKDRIWFAPFSGGLFIMEENHAKRVTVAGLDHDVVYSISGSGNEIWIGRERGGLTVLTESGNSFVARTYTRSDGLPQNSVYSVRCLQDGAVLAGTVSSGVSRLSAGRFTNYSDADGLPSNAVNSIAESADGTVWVATANGLASYSNAKWTGYTDRDGLPSSSVKVIFEDSTRNLWIATSGGLSYLSSGKITVPRHMPEILREQILGIAEDSLGFLWFTTADNVVRVNREKLLTGGLLETDIQGFGAEDGLKGTEVVSRANTLVADPAGRIWLSLSSGLSMADPTVTMKNFGSGSVRIDSISAGGRQLDRQVPIKIPAGIQTITFNYGGTNLSSPERIRFRYKLDGSSQGWSDIVASKQVVFSNLEPRSYQFRIVASSSAGLWNGPETIIPFVIEPAFWQTWWFRVLCCIALLGILWAAYVLRLKQVTRLLHLRHQERLSEREDIARDLHDTFFQDVQSLFLRLHTASRHLPHENPTRQALEEVLDDSDRIMTDGRKMFLDLPTKESQEGDFAEMIADHCKEFASAHPVEYRIEVDGQPRSLDTLVRSELEKIAREAIYNAFRHSKAKAIEVELTYGKREMQLRVRDNGQGFEPSLLQTNSGHQHLGLQNMRRRADKIDAKFRLWSRLGSGTELEIILAAQRAYGTRQKTWTFLSSQRKG
jgi:ligand-binding sensor domain-containing protein/signal transduction histidine kinase